MLITREMAPWALDEDLAGHLFANGHAGVFDGADDVAVNFADNGDGGAYHKSKPLEKLTCFWLSADARDDAALTRMKKRKGHSAPPFLEVHRNKQT